MQRSSQRLLRACLAWVLLSLTAGQSWEDDNLSYYGTSEPDYDYNHTIQITFFSNTSDAYEDFGRFLDRDNTTSEWEESSIPGEEAGEGSQEDTQDTDKGTLSMASRTTPLGHLLATGLVLHQLLWHL